MCVCVGGLNHVRCRGSNRTSRTPPTCVCVCVWGVSIQTHGAGGGQCVQIDVDEHAWNVDRSVRGTCVADVSARGWGNTCNARLKYWVHGREVRKKYNVEKRLHLALVLGEGCAEQM